MNRKKAGRLARLLMFMGVSLMFIGLLGLAVPQASAAQAVESETSTEEYDFELNLNVGAIDSVEASFDRVVKSRVTAEGKVVLGPIRRDGGTRHWKTRDAKMCPLLASYPTDYRLKRLGRTYFVKKGAALTQFKYDVMSDKVVKTYSDGRQKLSVLCFRIGHGDRFPDTGKDPFGGQHGFGNIVRGPPMLFEATVRTVREADGDVVNKLVPTRRGQDRNGDGEVDEGDCWNPKANVVKYQLAQIEYTDSYYWRAQGEAIAEAAVSGRAKISEGECELELDFNFRAAGSASFDVIVKGRTEAQARGAAVKIINTSRIHADAEANAIAYVKATLRANFGDGCTNPPGETTGDVICKNPPHLYAPGGNGFLVREISRSDNVKPALSQFSVEALNDYAYFAQPTEFGWREEAQVNPCPTNVLCVRVQVWAVSPGLFKYVAKFAMYDQLNGQFLVEPDDF